MTTIGTLSVGRQISFWLNYRPGIYYHNFGGNYPLIDSDFLIDVPITPGITDIGAVFSDTDSLTEVFNVNDLANGPSFFYNTGTKMLYIRLANYDPPDVHNITVGPVYAFANEAYTDEATGTVYESRLLSSINISRKKDTLFYGKIVYKDFKIVLDNSDGTLYDIQNWDVFGQPVDLSYGDKTKSAASFTKIKTGTVKDYAFIEDTVEINVRDSRRVLEKSLPVTRVTTAVYANADRDKNKFIPIPYGACREVPCRVINDGASPANYTFVCADVSDHPLGIKAISTVYVDGISTAFSSVSLTAATFSIASTAYKTGQKVTADIEGFVNSTGGLIQNPLDILEDIFDVYLDTPFNSNYFLVGPWEDVKPGLANVSYCAVKSKKIDKIVELFGSPTVGGLNVTPDNKFTWLTQDDAAQPLFQIKDEDWKDYPQVIFDSDETLSGAIVNYNQEWATGDFLTVLDDTKEQDFRQTFKTTKDVTPFDTGLINQADAEAYAAELVSRYTDIQIRISGTIDLNLSNPTYVLQVLSLQPGNNIDVSVNGLEIRNGKLVKTDIVGRFKGELLEIDADPENEQAEILVRYIEPYDTIVTDAIPIGYGAIGYGAIGEAGVINV